MSLYSPVVAAAEPAGRDIALHDLYKQIINIR